MGTLDILSADRGCVVSGEDEAEFASHAADLLRDDAARSALGADAQRYAATWAALEMARRLATLYGETMRAAPRAALHSRAA
jgi:hypothetical protein